MSSPPHFLLPLSIFFFFFFFFFSKPSNGAASNLLESICPSEMCGAVNISYPFWRSDSSTSAAGTSYCGYPGFGLNCSSDNGDPIFKLPNDAYYVKDISYTDLTLTLVDIDVTSNKTCPRARHNVTLEDYLPLHFDSLDLNLTFYFDCSSKLTAHATDIECLRSGENRSFVFVQGEEPEGINWTGNCEEKVVATVMDGEIDQTNGLISGFGGAMNKGFSLNWTQWAACAKCEEADGRCGYNDRTQRFICFCPDGTTSTTNCKGMHRALSLSLHPLWYIGVLFTGID